MKELITKRKRKGEEERGIKSIFKWSLFIIRERGKTYYVS